MFDSSKDTRQGVAIFGSTGSVGRQTLDVLSRFPDRFRVHALIARSSADTLIKQILQFHPSVVSIEDEAAYEKVVEAIKKSSLPRSEYPYILRPFRNGQRSDLLERIARDPDAPIVVAAMMGFAGLRSTIEAVKAGKHVALANKESLVVAGELIMTLAKKHGTVITPVDSEHSAIAQCLVGETSESIKRIILTASGGPFRTRSFDTFADITLGEALKHPNWEMGKKITIDSATMMNKGLEVIEAKWLFDVPLNKIDVIVHPQSIIHSMVEFCDGSIKAQLGAPDMRLPIQYALGYPERLRQEYDLLDLAVNNRMDFDAPDEKRFPCLRLARQSAERGGVYPCILNAANEVAVEAFLSEKICFTDIARITESVISAAPQSSNDPFNASTHDMIEAGLQRIHAADEWARKLAKQFVTEGV